jgi:hypothetical protein
VAAIGKIGVIDTPLARYRETSGSLSMDDRRFLPQVLGVLDKAYGNDGVLRNHGRKTAAKACQYAGASWMAYSRKDRFTALRLILLSFIFWPLPLPISGYPKGIRLRTLKRYLSKHNDAQCEKL